MTTEANTPLHPPPVRSRQRLTTSVTGRSFYITSSRYRSMVTDYMTPMDKTYAVLGKPKISLQQGVNETITRLRTQPPTCPR